MVGIGFMIVQSITGKVSSVESDECEPDYLLEKIYYEDVDTGYMEARCRSLCWRNFHTDSIKVERLENKVNGLDFVRLVCYCDQNDCGQN